MQQDLIESGFEDLLARRITGGGFIGRAQGGYRPDATAWSILALQARGENSRALQSARDRLVADQLSDGRVCISPTHEEGYWPTSLAILAWRSSPDHYEARERAVQFLLNSSGRHFQLDSDSPVGHNTNLKGWSWTENTHSWTDPTALAVMALRAVGNSAHQRVREAEKMLLDRQLPNGGWNYGNTEVFGQELRPLPESTGLALNALSATVSRGQVEHSLEYLKSRYGSLNTPRSLAWSLLALGAWGERPDTAEDLIFNCLGKKRRYGGFDTGSLALVLLSFKAHRGLLDIFQD